MSVNQNTRLYRKLERDFNVAQAVPVARAALGLMAVLRTWVSSGNSSRVALPANVCHDVIAAILGAGCEPFFCDIDLLDGNVKSSEWARAKSAGSKVALVVHAYGNPADISVVHRYFSSEDELIIDDAAQALGSTNQFGLVGGQGDVGLISFGKTKHIEVGGAALLFKNARFANEVIETIQTIEIVPEAQRHAIYANFRRKFDAARDNLRNQSNPTPFAFSRLLDGYAPSLQLEFPNESANSAYIALENYQKSIDRRLEKTALWMAGLNGSCLVPVGMGDGAVPWRFSCRLPGLTWPHQHVLAQKLRAQGLNVSHWYLPGHWLCEGPTNNLPGVEQLAQEVFQFWIDDETSLKEIEVSAKLVKEITSSKFYEGE